jgi:5-methylcytosine-specific restriction endonuclease McrA
MSQNARPSCVYCGSDGPFTDEHVLARAFAGPNENWMLKDLVCAKCNKLFSTYERAWTSAPGEASARINWGPAGRKRKGVAFQAHLQKTSF